MTVTANLIKTTDLAATLDTTVENLEYFLGIPLGNVVTEMEAANIANAWGVEAVLQDVDSGLADEKSDFDEYREWLAANEDEYSAEENEFFRRYLRP